MILGKGFKQGSLWSIVCEEIWPTLYIKLLNSFPLVIPSCTYIFVDRANEIRREEAKFYHVTLPRRFERVFFLFKILIFQLSIPFSIYINLYAYVRAVLVITKEQQPLVQPCFAFHLSLLSFSWICNLMFVRDVDDI